ncbi:MAG TPA: PilZ domain-containing protein [Gaiellales bacterium]|jgi:hypothetical protein|nr:PilZ domain-containing protein [Gaiellales bacterium]
MSILRSSSLAAQAAEIMPPLPAVVELLADAGGALRLELLSRAEHGFRARGPRLRITPQMQLRARVTAGEGRRFDVELRVAGLTPESQWTTLALLEVVGLSELPNRRSAPRCIGHGPAPAQALTCRAISANSVFEVSIADLSASGLAFVSELEFHVGDTVAVMPKVAGSPVRLRARVLHTEPGKPGNRVGCEITAITDANRRRIARLAGNEG